jgi:Fe-S-cluster containining protein
MPAATPDPRPTVRIELRVLGERIAVETPQPQGKVRLDEVLPFMRAIDDEVIGVAVRLVEAKGETVSCRKGCSTCCRAQPVPVTPAEAYALLCLVETMPQPRRGEVEQRFADRVERLRASGLLPAYQQRDPALTQDEARQIARHYFQLGLVCPFLEDDACGIYPDRPFVCRQYLVTSPAELCRDPFGNPVKSIALPTAPAGAALEVATEKIGRDQFTVPLVLALEYARAHRDELERTYEPEGLYQRTVQALFRQ